MVSLVVGIIGGLVYTLVMVPVVLYIFSVQFSVWVNGKPFFVPDGVNQVLSDVHHPVLAWRDGECVFLAGSSRILVHCSGMSDENIVSLILTKVL